MWIDRVIFKPRTDREDFYDTIGLFDDDSGAPVNLSGLTLAIPGVAFTAAAWTVTDGAISTTSSTSLTLPGYPIGNQLAALQLTVGTGLGILAGDPVAITDTATKQNTANGFVQSYNATNGVLIAQVGWTYQFEIRRGGPRNTGSGYIPWWDWGTPDDLGPLLSASLANGYLHLIDQSVIEVNIPESVIKTIGDLSSSLDRAQADAPGTYMVSMTGTDSVNTRQFFIGTASFQSGGVTN
jgi:hypothetical protein